LARIQDTDFKLLVVLAVESSVRWLDGDYGDWGPGDECLFSKFRSNLCLEVLVMAILCDFLTSAGSFSFVYIFFF
jgi:hypothetical protein